MLVKICCIQSEGEARRALAAGANAIGLVAEMPTATGVIADSRIREIVATLAPDVRSFLLTSRTDPEAIVEHQRATGASTLQLVDRVSAQSRAAVRRRLPHVSLVQVIHVVRGCAWVGLARAQRLLAPPAPRPGPHRAGASETA